MTPSNDQYQDELTITEIGPSRILRRDLKEAATNLSISEARYLVDMYYQTQTKRIRAGNQVKASAELGEPNALVTLTFESFCYAENTIKSALNVYSKLTTPGLWLRSIHGVGPVIAAGLLAHIDMQPWRCVLRNGTVKPCTERKPHESSGCGHQPIHTVGHIWRFAGLDPTTEWKKRSRRPWNAELKTLCWKAGQSFMKLRSNPKDFYGKLYEQRKEQEIRFNEEGRFADQAKAILDTNKFKRDTIARACYEKGVLPPGHIDARARRWTVKLFLAHYHHVAYHCVFGKEPPKPYVIEHLGHTDIIDPPNWPME